MLWNDIDFDETIRNSTYFKDDSFLLLQGDCTALLSHIPHNCIDLVCTDPPYNIGIDEWDKIPNYRGVFNNWADECTRVIKKGSTIMMFHNDMAQFSEIIADIKAKNKLYLYQFITIDKPSYADKIYNNFNTYVGSAEYLGIWGNVDIQDTYDLEQIQYFQKVRDYIGLSKKEIKRIVPGADHCFRISSGGNYALPSKQTYAELVDKFKIDEMEGFMSYKSLFLQRPVFNCSGKNNVWNYNFRGEKSFGHKTQKPERLIRDLVKVHSNIGDIVLDFTIGSGTSAVACRETERKCIGIESSAKYCEITKNRYLSYVNSMCNRILI